MFTSASGDLTSVSPIMTASTIARIGGVSKSEAALAVRFLVPLPPEDAERRPACRGDGWTWTDGKAAQHMTGAKKTVDVRGRRLASAPYYAACRAGWTDRRCPGPGKLQCSGRSIAMIKAFSGTAAAGTGTGLTRGAARLSAAHSRKGPPLPPVSSLALALARPPSVGVGPWIHAGPSFPWRNEKQMGVEGCPWIHRSAATESDHCQKKNEELGVAVRSRRTNEVARRSGLKPELGS